MQSNLEQVAGYKSGNRSFVMFALITRYYPLHLIDYCDSFHAIFLLSIRPEIYLQFCGQDRSNKPNLCTVIYMLRCLQRGYSA